MAIEGDFEKLAHLKAQLEDTAGLMRKAEERVAEKLQEQLDYQYETGTDPNNEGWAELAPATLARGRKPPPLTDTEEMKRHSNAVRGVGGINVNIDKRGDAEVLELSIMLPEDQQTPAVRQRIVYA